MVYRGNRGSLLNCVRPRVLHRLPGRGRQRPKLRTATDSPKRLPTWRPEVPTHLKVAAGRSHLGQSPNRASGRARRAMPADPLSERSPRRASEGGSIALWSRSAWCNSSALRVRRDQTHRHQQMLSKRSSRAVTVHVRSPSQRQARCEPPFSPASKACCVPSRAMQHRSVTPGG